jgi:hypothetical protein
MEKPNLYRNDNIHFDLSNDSKLETIYENKELEFDSSGGDIAVEPALESQPASESESQPALESQPASESTAELTSESTAELTPEPASKLTDMIPTQVTGRPVDIPGSEFPKPIEYTPLMRYNNKEIYQIIEMMFHDAWIYIKNLNPNLDENSDEFKKLVQAEADLRLKQLEEIEKEKMNN